MTDGYDKTPSFFNNEETFSKYLGQTSYYTGLQDAVFKLIKLIRPKNVVELGSALGTTLVECAKLNLDVVFTGLDIRPDVVDKANESVKKQGLANVSFMAQDMGVYAKNPLPSDLTFLLYAFHHILDPLTLKEQFLRDMFDNMSEGSYLCIAESFIPEESSSLEDKERILNLWRIRSLEGQASTFWKSLDGLDSESIRVSKAISEYCRDQEYLAGTLVANRDNEYLVKASWVVEVARSIGFDVVIDQPINCIGDGLILLRK